MNTEMEQMAQPSTGAVNRSAYAEKNRCTKCDSLVISRVQRTFFQKLSTKKMRYYCHDCTATYWKE